MADRGPLDRHWGRRVQSTETQRVADQKFRVRWEAFMGHCRQLATAPKEEGSA